MTYDEYQNLSMKIVSQMKQFEISGTENVQQNEIVNKLIQDMIINEEGQEPSAEKVMEVSKKITNVIGYLITKENVLMISQDARVKNERFLCLSVNTDLGNMNI